MRGELRFPILNISSWLETNREEYQNGLLNVSLTGQWDEWVSFISAAVSSVDCLGVDTSGVVPRTLARHA